MQFRKSGNRDGRRVGGLARGRGSGDGTTARRTWRRRWRTYWRRRTCRRRACRGRRRQERWRCQKRFGARQLMAAARSVGSSGVARARVGTSAGRSQQFAGNGTQRMARHAMGTAAVASAAVSVPALPPAPWWAARPTGMAMADDPYYGNGYGDYAYGDGGQYEAPTRRFRIQAATISTARSVTGPTIRRAALISATTACDIPVPNRT